MRTIRSLCALLAIAALASCGTTATTVVSRQRLDRDLAGKLAFESVEVTSSVRRFTQVDLDQLKDAVRERMPPPRDGGMPVTVRLVVNDYGPGASKLVVAVNVVDAAGKTYARFDVYRTASAVLGTVFDQRTSVINAVADGIGQSLMTLPVAPAQPTNTRDYGG